MVSNIGFLHMSMQPDARKVNPRRNARLEYRPNREVAQPGDEPLSTAALDAKEAGQVAVEASPSSRGSAPDADVPVTEATAGEIKPISPRSPPPASQSKNEEPESRCPRCA